MSVVIVEIAGCCTGVVHQAKVIDGCTECGSSRGFHVPHFSSNPEHRNHCTCDGCY